MRVKHFSDALAPQISDECLPESVFSAAAAQGDDTVCDGCDNFTFTTFVILMLETTSESEACLDFQNKPPHVIKVKIVSIISMKQVELT